MKTRPIPNYNPLEHLPTLCTSRREFLEKTGMGYGALCLASIFGMGALADSRAEATVAGAGKGPLAPKAPHFPVKAKRVIHIFASGAPSQMDTWDPKPTLEKYADQTLPGMGGLAYASPFKFSQHGKSGIEVSEVFPKLAQHVDKMAVIRSLWTDIPAHEVAQRFMNTGSLQIPKPSWGSWVLYGLGTENQNMPGFITLGSRSEWRQASFLPGFYQGVNVNFSARTKPEEALQNLRNQFSSTSVQRSQLDLAQKLNRIHSAVLQRDEQLESRIEAFEMAFKMQTEATDAFDISKEPQNIRSLYGSSEMGARLLLARRLVERGVRFVQVHHGGWDHHNALEDGLRKKAGEMDVPAAALLTDLAQRGLLDDTLVIWGGEFGRTSTRDRNGNENPGRDHNGRAAVAWLAGGGIKGGTIHGATDEFGSRAVTDKVHVHDLHATVLALLGFDHTKLTYRYNGRDFRFTDNYGSAVKDIIA
jgi:hypothetical protein